MQETEQESLAGLTPSGIVLRLERRVTQGRRFGRDVEELFRHLSIGVTSGDWPVNAHDRLELALRAYRAASLWSVRLESTPRAMRAATEGAVIHIYNALRALAPGEGAVAVDALLDAWSESQLLPRQAFAEVILEGCDAGTLRVVETNLLRRAHKLKHQIGAAMESLSATVDVPTASAREHNIFYARLLSRSGRLAEALSALESEPTSDPKVLLAYADVLVEHAQHEAAVERLKRCLVVAPDRTLVREKLIDAFLAVGNVDAAIEQGLLCVGESGDPHGWDLVCEALAGSHADRLRAVRDGLETEQPALYVEIVIAEGDFDGVLRASRAKTFSYEQLWRIGDFLAQDGTPRAARVYERAINLQAAVAQSKAECQDFGARLEAVAPYFAAIERPTKVVRLAREVLATHRTNLPLRRELERLFGAAVK